MYRQFFNWRIFFPVVAILIVTGTIFYSQYLSEKIAEREKQKIEQWMEASKSILKPGHSPDTRLPLEIKQDNDEFQ